MTRQDLYYSRFLEHLGLEPTASQERFFREAAEFLTDPDAPILVLSGYAGTGKTTAVAAIVKTLQGVGRPFQLMAPTGRAAKVLSGYSGRTAYTIHKRIYRQNGVTGSGTGRFTLAPNEFKNTVFIVDEVSLIGSGASSAGGQAVFGSGNLLEDLISYVRSGRDCKLMLVGDPAQLPPVGDVFSPALDENVMGLFGARRFPVLTEVVRQEEHSGILTDATILRGLITSLSPGAVIPAERLVFPGKGFPDVERIGGGDLIECITTAYDRYGEDQTIVLCRSNRRSNRYNDGIRAQVQYKEERLVRGDKLMVVKNNYKFVEEQKLSGLDFIANGDIVTLERIGHYEERFGLHFARATFSLPDYGDQEVTAPVILDTLDSENASLTPEQSQALYEGLCEFYGGKNKSKRYKQIREDPYYNAFQIKYAQAITGHKSQGGQWDCVFIDNPFWRDELELEDLRWLYTAFTRAVKKVYLVNFQDRYFR